MKEEEVKWYDDMIPTSLFVRMEEHDKDLHDILNIIINTVLT